MGYMNILLTGGAGYIGTTVLEYVLKTYPSDDVVVFDNLSKGRIENIGPLKDLYHHFDFEKVDLRDYQKVEDLVKQYKPDAVLHLAALVDAFSTNRKGKDEECMEVNYRASVELANVCKRNGVRDFVFQSTVSLYSQGSELAEESEKMPLSTYGKSKLLAEKETFALSDDHFRVCTLRPATVVGYNPGFRYETIINQACIFAVYGIKSYFFESAMTGNKSYLTLEDNARALMFAVEHMQEMNGQSYNISSFETNLKKVTELIDLALRESVHRSFDSYSTVSEKTINQQVYTVSSQKIQHLGFVPHGSLESTVRETVRGVLAQQAFLTAHYRHVP